MFILLPEQICTRLGPTSYAIPPAKICAIWVPRSIICREFGAIVRLSHVSQREMGDFLPRRISLLDLVYIFRADGFVYGVVIRRVRA